jgi:hypothetical protein
MDALIMVKSNTFAYIANIKHLLIVVVVVLVDDLFRFIQANNCLAICLPVRGGLENIYGSYLPWFDE